MTPALNRFGPLAVTAAVLLTACGGAAAPASTAPSAVASSPAPSTGKPSAPAASKPALQNLTVAVPAQSLSHFPLVVGKETGIFARHGINITIQQIKTDAAIAANISGEVPYSTPAGSLIRAIAQGAPLRLVVTIMDKSNHLMVVNPKTVPTGKDLAGKRVAINALADNTQYETEAVLEHFGIDKKNVSYVVVPDEGPKLAALVGGSVDGAIMSLPFKSEEAGFKVLSSLTGLLELPTSILATSNQMIANHPADVQNMVDATIESMRYTKAHKAETLPIIAKTFDLNPAQSERAYDISKDAWSDTGILSPTAFQNVVQPLNLSPPPALDKAWDPQFVAKAKAG